MLSLDSPRWRELRHAYGPAVDTPALLAELRAYPRCEGEKEPWWSIWSSLAHQGDVYSASFAAVPHVVAALATNPLRCDSSYIHLPAWVEICRVKNNTLIPADLEVAYFAALKGLPLLAAKWAEQPLSDPDLVCVLCAIAAAKGHAAIAETVLELRDENAARALEWLSEN